MDTPCKGRLSIVRTAIGWIAVAVASLVVVAGPATAQDSRAAKAGAPQAGKHLSDEDLLKASQNPVADLVSLPIQFIGDFRVGPYDRTESAISLQPVIPVTLSDDWLLVTRIIQPIVWRPDYDSPSGRTFGLGDMSPTLFLVPRHTDALTWGVGPAMVIPTATNSRLGQGKFSIGPSAVVLAQPGPWTIGALVNNVWSVAGSDGRPSVNRMALQYFVARILDNDWYANSSPTIVADWKADRSNRWLVPVGGGIGRLVMYGTTPVDFAASAYVNAVRPDGGPRWQLNLQVTLLFPK